MFFGLVCKFILFLTGNWDSRVVTFKVLALSSHTVLAVVEYCILAYTLCATLVAVWIPHSFLAKSEYLDYYPPLGPSQGFLGPHHRMYEIDPDLPVWDMTH